MITSDGGGVKGGNMDIYVKFRRIIKIGGVGWKSLRAIPWMILGG
jgi:hypothetical protein